MSYNVDRATAAVSRDLLLGRNETALVRAAIVRAYLTGIKAAASRVCARVDLDDVRDFEARERKRLAAGPRGQSA